MLLTPTSDQVLIQLDEFEERFGPGSHIIRADIAQDKPMWGTVLAVGPGRVGKHGGTIAVEAKQGARVCIPWRTGHDFTIAGRLCVFAHDEDLLAAEEP